MRQLCAELLWLIAYSLFGSPRVGKLTMTEVAYSRAARSDVDDIAQLLCRNGLPSADIADHVSNFFVAKAQSELIGVVGIEVLGKVGLLRSMVVESHFRKRRIAQGLFWRTAGHAKLLGVARLYLLTLSASGFFERLGFAAVDRASVPADITSTRQFTELCPAAAKCLFKNLETHGQYYPREVLQLRPESPGASMWGVNLPGTMLTYFEVQPNSRFELHAHQSEQITLVLVGELFFEMAEVTVQVRQGEVIAIPSNLPHAVFTKDNAARAVDAWSPIMDRYG